VASWGHGWLRIVRLWIRSTSASVAPRCSTSAGAARREDPSGPRGTVWGLSSRPRSTGPLQARCLGGLYVGRSRPVAARHRRTGHAAIAHPRSAIPRGDGSWTRAVNTRAPASNCSTSTSGSVARASLTGKARAGSSRAGTRCRQRLDVAAYATACSAL
jgi:hypothetical protein